MNHPMQVPETPSQLRAVLNARGLAPNKRYGQNFLVEPKILDVIMRLAELEPEDFVLEVGTGAGTLTRRLSALLLAGVRGRPALQFRRLPLRVGGRRLRIEPLWTPDGPGWTQIDPGWTQDGA